MDKFITFKGWVFNTRYIISMCKNERNVTGMIEYSIELQTTNNTFRQWFDSESERDMVFNQLSKDFLNE